METKGRSRLKEQMLGKILESVGRKPPRIGENPNKEIEQFDSLWSRRMECNICLSGGTLVNSSLCHRHQAWNDIVHLFGCAETAMTKH